MPAHPELESEQAYIDFAYECVEQTRAAAIAMTAIPEPGPGGTFQARYERDVMWERMSTSATRRFVSAASMWKRTGLSMVGWRGATALIPFI